MELNGALLQGDAGSFVLAHPAFPEDVRYVITIDEDTQLIRDCAKKLVGAMAHPLNRPVLSEDGRCVLKGFSLMQPRVVSGVENADRSLFSRLISGYKGIDRYAFTVSDIFQDLFGEGGFMGKGIYDLPVFYQVMQDRLPDNAVLSHDLLEGIYTRTAFVSDVELVDSFPAGYIPWLRRQHRWVRGDWQLLPFLRRKVENRKGEAIENNLSAVGRWRIVDNLRRSAQPIAEWLLIFCALLFLPGDSWPYFLLVAAGIFAGALVEIVAVMPVLWSSSGVLRGSVLLIDIGMMVLRGLFKLALLPMEAIKMLDAIVRSLWRTFVSRRNMLQWVTAAAAEKRLKGALWGYYLTLWPQVVAAVLLVVLSIVLGRMGPLTLVLAALWLTAPGIAWALSRPVGQRAALLSSAQQKEMRLLARRTWAYFEEFQDMRNHFLVPDNYQEVPRKGLARRTSPTNMGLSLVCGISALNFGFIGLFDLRFRIDQQLETFSQLKMWNGHFYNWYDTATLAPLRPAYISSVDSGNMASYLLLCAEGLRQAEKSAVFGRCRLEAIELTLDAAREDGEEIDPLLEELLSNMAEEEVGPDLYDLLHSAPGKVEHRGRWGRRISRMLDALLADMERYLPWSAYLPLQEETRPFYAVSFCDLTAGIQELLKKAGDIPFDEELKKRMKSDLLQARSAAYLLLRKNGETIKELHRYFEEMDFSVLYDKRRELFYIGMDLENGKLSKSHYDLLASEARTTSFIAIAKRDVPMKHWFRLGRPMAAIGKGRMLLSWSGTMFEYFMPMIAMKDYRHTLMHETYEMALLAQRQAAEEGNIPFGISESAFYAFDMHLNYQYKAFGVPACSMSDHGNREMVVSPYSTALVLPFAPHTAYKNLKRLSRLDAAGEYGYYDAVDFTEGRLPGNRKYFVVKTFMAHHQGMTLCALDNLVNGNILQHTFHSIPLVQAAEILLQEEVSRGGVTIRRREYGRKNKGRHSEYRSDRHISFTSGHFPQVQLLSNGKYRVMLTDAGTGYSAWGDGMVNRWRSDANRDGYGIFYYIRPVGEEGYWSPAYRPAQCQDGEYSVRFESGKAVFVRAAQDFTTTMEVCVSPESDVEIRRISIENHTDQDREMQLTQFLETVLCSKEADIAHRAFVGLFVETGLEGDIVYARYKPGGREREMNLACAYHVEGEALGKMDVETERIKAIGRLRDVGNPRMMDKDAALGTAGVGAPIDPCLCCRLRVMARAGAKVSVSFALAVAATTQEAVAAAKEYEAKASIERAFEMAWTRSQVELRHLQSAPGDLSLFHKIAARLLFAGRTRLGGGGVEVLWECGVSGDIPVLLVRIADLTQIDNLQRLFKAYEFFRSNGLDLDLIVLNEYGNDYIRPLHDKISEMIAALRPFATAYGCGRVVLLEKAWVAREDALLVAADLVVDAKDLALEALEADGGRKKKQRLCEYEPVEIDVPPLLMDNSIGGFSQDGKEYIMWLQKGRTTPLPWCNVMANPYFGTICSESGGGYTWAQNSREYKISPWTNDQIGDGAGEMIFLRDEESGEVWSPVPGRLGCGDYLVRHGWGYSQFEYGGYGLRHKLTVHVDDSSPSKFYSLRLDNPSPQPRRIVAAFYCDFILGAFKHQTWKYVEVEFDGRDTLVARREDRPAVYLRAPKRPCGALTDKAAFWGYGDGAMPQGLRYEKLDSGKSNGEPCGVLYTTIEIPGYGSDEIVFELCCGQEEERGLLIAADAQSARRSLENVRESWARVCDKLVVKTPDVSMNVLLGWMKYQTLSSRFWGRTGFYQAGGAYGFRDQLQDCICLLDTNPDLVREHILLCAAHQFPEGDVQHWWHPPAKGVRTHISDDLLFLPYVTALYIQHTGDADILQEEAPFLEGPQLEPGQEDSYIDAQTGQEQGSLLEHCMRALERTRFGEHGLPLMGGGDWNDGMNRVGREGKGESVWLGFFLYEVLKQFLPWAREAGDGRAEHWEAKMPELEAALDTAWDGAWFRRAYFDDGTSLGSAHNPECSIDIISQAWAVLSGAAQPYKQRQAFDSALSLVDREAGLIKLLSPPFESWKDPGYIQGYIPGVRENGGQYTHAAAWMVAAAAKLGLGETAFELFSILNPINHGRTDKEIMAYKAEPYVVAADVYSNPQHNGRGGWTWYTGSASWMYVVATEAILGFCKRGETLTLNPCIPAKWAEFSIEYRYGDSLYRIEVENPDKVERGVRAIYVDGVLQEKIALETGKGEVLVRVIMGQG
ncbi:MAG: GH36-type glycosyl hydrolase domain-containing protein [Christensenellales bacterium]